MRITENLEMLEVPTNVLGTPGQIYPTLIRDDANTVLVDAGYPGQSSLLLAAIAAAGAAPVKLNAVIVTHHDIDHIGGLGGLLDGSHGSPEVLCHEHEAPYLRGEQLATKVAKLEAELSALPNQMKEVYQGMKRFYTGTRITVARTLADGEELPLGGGIEVIHTPGHTPGHICLYHRKSRTLIAGDALTIDGGKLVAGPAFTNWDNRLSSESLQKLRSYQIDRVICYHGGLYEGGANRRLAELSF